MPISTDDFNVAAGHAYKSLKKKFDSEAYFWRCGHSFDTIIDYFVATHSRDDAKEFATVAINKYNSQSGAWYDDFGWWGISGLKASEAGIFGDHEAHFRSIATACWKQMFENAPYGWKWADQTTYAHYAPLFDGGVWNHIVDTGCHPSGPDQLCGRQNTVTNGLYLVLAQRLSLDDKLLPDLTYRLAANQEYHFLKNWFDLPEEAKALMNNYGAGRAFVRERVSIFKPTDQNGQHYQDPAFRSELAWAGDQGLILGGLVDRMRIVGKASTEYPALLATARKLMAGARDYLTTQATPAGTLQPWWPNGAPGGDDDDYWTGPAVFMRYLLNAFQNEDLRIDILRLDYQAFIRANAEYVVNFPDRPQTSNPVDLVVDLTNNLAILVAAIVMLAAIN